MYVTMYLYISFLKKPSFHNSTQNKCFRLHDLSIFDWKIGMDTWQSNSNFQWSQRLSHYKGAKSPKSLRLARKHYWNSKNLDNKDAQLLMSEILLNILFLTKLRGIKICHTYYICYSYILYLHTGFLRKNAKDSLLHDNAIKFTIK